MKKFFLACVILLSACGEDNLPKIPLCVEESDNVPNEVWDLKTENGADLDYIIKAGTANLDTEIGCYASGSDSFVVFEDFFKNVIFKYHGFNPYEIQQLCDRKPSSFVNISKFKSRNKIASTEISISRGIHNISFPSKSTKSERLKAEAVVVKALRKLTEDLAGTYKTYDKLDAAEKEYFSDLLENKDLQNSGISADMPFGRGLFVSKDKHLIVIVNGEDHLKIITKYDGYDIQSAMKKINSALHILQHDIPFAMARHIGYVTSSPANVGTGMHIKLTINTKNNLDKKVVKLKKRKIRLEKIPNSNFYTASNMITFGPSEAQIINDFHSRLVEYKII